MEQKVAHVERKAASSAAVLEAELAAAEANAEMERQLRDDLSGAYSDYSLLGAARKLLTGDELVEALRIPSLGAIGEKTKTMGELGARRKRDLGKVVSMLMGRILQVAYRGEEKDPRKVLEAVLGRRGSTTRSWAPRWRSRAAWKRGRKPSSPWLRRRT